jgi:hypothetical protein
MSLSVSRIRDKPVGAQFPDNGWDRQGAEHPESDSPCSLDNYFHDNYFSRGTGEKQDNTFRQPLGPRSDAADEETGQETRQQDEKEGRGSPFCQLLPGTSVYGVFCRIKKRFAHRFSVEG